MNPSDTAIQMLNEYVRYVNPKVIELGNREYSTRDFNLHFRDWLLLYLDEFLKQGKTRIGQHEDILFRLLREEDLDEFKDEIRKINEFPDVDAMYFNAGLYERIPALTHWQEEENELISLTVTTTFPEGLDKNTGSEGAGTSQFQISNKLKLRLCAAYHKLGLVGNGNTLIPLYKEIAQICEKIRRYPNRLPNILITGAPGTGKELIARSFANLSGRKGRFEAINCAGIPEQLLESELFGYEKGSFTGAQSDKPGIFEFCDGGTVQLDEINKISKHLQAKILRALQEREIRRVGATQTRTIDVLFIATTNEDLEEKVQQENFAEDLYQRLSEESLRMPLLRDHVEDIPLLVNHFLQEFPDNELDKYRFPVAMICKNLLSRSNIRKLKHTVGNLVRESMDLRAIWHDDREQKLWGAITLLENQKHAEPPFTRKQLAKEMNLSPSLLSSPEWKYAVEGFVEKGKIKATIS
jgi:transcriptional regulator of acetoin/glycerol metabolism